MIDIQGQGLSLRHRKLSGRQLKERRRSFAWWERVHLELCAFARSTDYCHTDKQQSDRLITREKYSKNIEEYGEKVQNRVYSPKRLFLAEDYKKKKGNIFFLQVTSL